jgi:hypothetical protein
MTRLGLFLAATTALVACHRAAAPPTPQPQTATRVSVRVGEGFSPRSGPEALAAFVPEVAPLDSAGECMLMRTSGAGATIATAMFPQRTNAKMQVTIMFDSSGRAVRYIESRNPPNPGRITPATPDAQRDSIMRAATNAVRTTRISLDFAIDQALATNSGGGRPTDAIIGTVRSFERLEKLGSPAARMERVRRLCGV